MSNGILITGGTGSFGRALAKNLLKANNFDRIVIYSRDEHKQEQMAKEIDDPDQRLRFLIGDIRDKDRLRLAMAGCWYVVHAAAMKIVPTAEYNPMECIKTNIIGAQNLIDVALENYSTTKKIIALSTDKAVNPVNLYGATKLCAEKLFIAANNLAGHEQAIFSIVRYGNVANSNGSVIPVFKKLLNEGKPLTVTSELMTRYWITLDDAVKFVLNSLYTMQGGEVFLPHMPSFNVMSLALAMTTSDNIITTGVRPGEKIHEQIEQDCYSHTNEDWLGIGELREKLKEMGII